MRWKGFFMFGFPKTLHSDNGKEFIGIKMQQFCHSYSIAQVHGAPRTPTTQGLVERGNRTFKENLSKILREKKAELNNWCSEAAYKKTSPCTWCNQRNSIYCYVGIQPWKETNHNNDLSTNGNNETSTIVTRSSSSQIRQGGRSVRKEKKSLKSCK